ncbi:MAG: hypothetical protein WC369_04485 [Dehalococcoidales bacterium]
MDNQKLMAVIMGAISGYLQLEQPTPPQPVAAPPPPIQSKTSFWHKIKCVFSNSEGKN